METAPFPTKSLPSCKESEWVERFIEALWTERNASQNTIEAYKRDLSEFSRFVGKSFSDVQQDDFYRFREFLEQTGRTSSTIARKIVALRRFFQFLFEEELILHNPAQHIALPKSPRPLPKSLSKDAIFRLLQFIAKDSTPQGRRQWLLFELLYGTGVRATELITLQLDQISIDPSTQTIRPYLLIAGKGGRERMVPMHDTCLLALKAYLEVRSTFGRQEESPWLFPSTGQSGHLTRQRLAQFLKEKGAEAGLDAKHLSPHVLRHAFATHLLENGANIMVIQKLLGHADISTTQIYTHIQTQRLIDLLEKHHPLFRRKPSYPKNATNPR